MTILKYFINRNTIEYYIIKYINIQLLHNNPYKKSRHYAIAYTLILVYIYIYIYKYIYIYIYI